MPVSCPPLHCTSDVLRKPGRSRPRRGSRVSMMYSGLSAAKLVVLFDPALGAPFSCLVSMKIQCVLPSGVPSFLCLSHMFYMLFVVGNMLDVSFPELGIIHRNSNTFKNADGSSGGKSSGPRGGSVTITGVIFSCLSLLKNFQAHRKHHVIFPPYTSACISKTCGHLLN